MGGRLEEAPSFRSAKQILSASARSKTASNICISGAQKIHLAQTEMCQMGVLASLSDLEHLDRQVSNESHRDAFGTTGVERKRMWELCLD